MGLPGLWPAWIWLATCLGFVAYVLAGLWLDGAATRDYLRAKNAVQPVSLWSAGCVFKNPDPERSAGRTAGQLLDQAGASASPWLGLVLEEASPGQESVPMTVRAWVVGSKRANCLSWPRM